MTDCVSTAAPAVSTGVVVGSPPVTPKQLADAIGRTAVWVRGEIRADRIATCPPHTAPYLIPAAALAAFGLTSRPKP